MVVGSQASALPKAAFAVRLCHLFEAELHCPLVFTHVFILFSFLLLLVWVLRQHITIEA